MLLAVIGTMSSISCIEPDPDHCAHQGGDLRGHAWCAVNEPEFPLCSRCESSDNGHFGCTDDRDEPLRCLVGRPEPGEETETGPEATGSSTGEASTGDDAACETLGFDPACSDEAPMCVDGECVGCSDTVCATLQPNDPLCAPGGLECVQCNPASEPSDCTDGFCDASYQCADACTHHEQCGPDGVCDLLTGECRDGPRYVVSELASCNGSDPFCTIEEAIAAVPDGGFAILAIATDLSNTFVEPGPLTISGGKRIAFVGTDFDRSTIVVDGSPSAIVVEGSEDTQSALYLRDIALEPAAPDPGRGITCRLSTVWLDDARVSGYEDGVVLNFCDQLVVRRSQLAGNAGTAIRTDESMPVGRITQSRSALVESSGIMFNGTVDEPEITLRGGIEFRGGEIRLSYATVYGNGLPSAIGNNVRCTATSAEIRNSIVINKMASAAAPSLDCGEVLSSVTEADFDYTVPPNAYTTWFGDDYRTDAHLTDNPEPSELFGDRGQWELGDALYDLDGMLRPEDGVVTFVGADEP